MVTLRPFQQDAIRALRKAPAHLLCVAPTGSGKSLIYERLISELNCRTVLFTPLTALARQQERTLARLGLAERVKILSPESLLNERTSVSLLQWRPEFMVVDECHCIQEWGSSFRPAFRLIPNLWRQLSPSRSLWLTATLPLSSRQELRDLIGPGLRELGGFEIPSQLQLRISKVSWPERGFALAEWLRDRREAGILFVSTRSGVQRLVRMVQGMGRSAVGYHAGLSREERLSIEQMVARGRAEVVVATTAFGMGMNFDHFRWVVLWQAPYTLLSMVQMLGRVTRVRDRASSALILWDQEDFSLFHGREIQNGIRERNQVLKFLIQSERTGFNAREHLESIFENEVQSPHRV